MSGAPPTPDAPSRRADLRRLVVDTVGVVRTHWRALLILSACTGLPVALAVEGAGAGRFTASYDDSLDALTALPMLLAYQLVVAPLLIAMVLHLLRPRDEDGDGGRPLRSLQAGLEVFAPLFLATVLAVLAIVAGLALLVLPGLFLLVRLAAVPQVVAVEGKRGLDALRASWALTDGLFWWVALVVVAANVAPVMISLPLGLIAVPVAESLDAEWVILAQETLCSLIADPVIAVVMALLYFDLRARSDARGVRA